VHYSQQKYVAVSNGTRGSNRAAPKSSGTLPLKKEGNAGLDSLIELRNHLAAVIAPGELVGGGDRLPDEGAASLGFGMKERIEKLER